MNNNEKNDNIVLGRYHNDFTKTDLIIVITGFTILIILAIILSCIYKIIGMYISSVIMILFSLIMIIMCKISYKQNINTNESIIIFDKDNNKLIINYYKKSINIKASEIEMVSYKNKFVNLSLLSIETTTEGNIILYLKNKKKIKTLKVNDVINAYLLIKDIINVEDITELV